MDPKLYKTLKQLIKLGILTKNTKVVRRRRKRNGKTSQSTRSVYRIAGQPTDHLKSNATTTYTTPTIQSEQAIVNLKASELQLEKALQNKDLPDDSKQKVILAIEDIKNQIAQQRNVTNIVKNAYTNLDYRIMGVKHDVSNQYDISEEPYEQSSYSQFVPQTKSNPAMSSNMGIAGDKPHIASTAHDYIFYDANKVDTIDGMDNPMEIAMSRDTPVKKLKYVEDEPESESEPESGAGLVHPEPEHKEPKSGYYLRKNKMVKLREEYAEIAGIEVENVNKKWDSDDLKEAIHRQKIKSLQKQYIDNGGTSKTYLGKDYDSVPGLELAVKRLIENNLKFA